jgi:hypothetical protein
MDTLVNDILLIIFNYILKITDKRSFLRVCKTINILTKNDIKIAEKQFNNKYSNIYEDNCPEKFIVELYYDGYVKINENEYKKLMSKRSIYLRGTKLSRYVKMIVAANNNELLELAICNGYRIGWDPSIIDFAVLLGRIDILICLNNNKLCFVNTNTIGLAAASGHLEVVEWLLNTKNCNLSYLNLCDAAKYGHLNIVKYIIFHKTHHDSYYSMHCRDYCEEAAKYGHLNILMWVKFQLNAKFSPYICEIAASAGHLNILIWLIDNGCEYDENTFNDATINGHLHILKWAHTNGLLSINDICEIAANNGKLYIIKWLYDIGTIFGPNIYICAAESGHLDLIKWLITINKNYINDIKVAINENNQTHIIEWFDQNGF